MSHASNIVSTKPSPDERIRKPHGDACKYEQPNGRAREIYQQTAKDLDVQRNRNCHPHMALSLCQLNASAAHSLLQDYLRNG